MASFSSRRRGRLVTRSKCPPRQASNTFAGVPRGVISPLMRMLVSRTALGTPTPASPRGSAPDKVHGLSGVLIGWPRGFSPVLRPHAIKHVEKTFPLVGEELIPVEVDHGDDRFPMLFHNNRIFFAGNSPNQLGKDGFRALLIHRFRHRQIVEGSYGEVKQRGGGWVAWPFSCSRNAHDQKGLARQLVWSLCSQSPHDETVVARCAQSRIDQAALE